MYFRIEPLGVIVAAVIDNSFMKLLLVRFLSGLALLLAFAGMAVPGQAGAREDDGARDQDGVIQSERFREREQRRPERRLPREAGEAARQLAPRERLPDLSGEMDGSLERPRDARGVERSGRLSPEERRALRREILDAGQEVYRSPGRSLQAPGSRRER